MSRPIIKLRKKPSPPDFSSSVIKTMDLAGGELLERLVEFAGKDYISAHIEVDSYYDATDVSLVVERPLTEAEQEEERNKYLKELASYENWAETNKFKIQQEKERQKALKKKQDDKIVAVLLKQKEKLEKKIAHFSQ